MSEQVGHNPREQYLDVISRNPRKNKWFDFQSNLLPNLLNHARDSVDGGIMDFTRALSGIKFTDNLPAIEWSDNDPVTMALTGDNLFVPVMEFDWKHMQTYSRIFGQEHYGFTLGMPIEIVSLGKLSSNESPDMPLVMIPSREVIERLGTWTYEDVRGNEFTHSTDAGFMEKPSYMAEMVAVIGARSIPGKRLEPVDLDPLHIVKYAAKAILREGRCISEREVNETARLVNLAIHNSTHQIPHVPNDVTARELMKFNTLEELQVDHPEYFVPGNERVIPSLTVNQIIAVTLLEANSKRM